MSKLEALFGDEAEVILERDFQLLLLISVMIPFGNGVLSPILDSLIEPLGTSVTAIGLMISVFLVPSIIVIPIVGILADRYGRKPILTPAIVLFGLAGALIAVTTDFRIALALRFLQGIGWAGLVALVVTSIGDLYDGSKETTAQGLQQSGTGLAAGGVSLVAGVLVVLAWQTPFLLYLFAVPVAVAVHLWFEEPTARDAATSAAWDGRAVYGLKLLRLARQRRVLTILVARPLPTVVLFGFLTYNSVLVVRLLDGSPAQAGVLFALTSVAVAGAASQVGRATALCGGRYRALLVANVFLGVGLLIAFVAPTLVVAGLGVVILGIGFGVTLPVYRALVTGFAPESMRAGLVSLYSTGGRIGSVVTPVAMGGAIAALTPKVGFTAAVQLAGLGVAVVGAGGGIVCVLVALTAPPVPDEQFSGTG